MKVLLVDCDSTIPNLALMRLAWYYKSLGYIVVLIRLCIPVYGKPKQKTVDCSGYDLAYVSAIFDTTPKHVAVIEGNCKVDYGGTGYDIGSSAGDDRGDGMNYPDSCGTVAEPGASSIAGSIGGDQQYSRSKTAGDNRSVRME